jgi:hypothetical protein
LIDASDENSLLLSIPLKKNIAYDEVCFLLGIDSLTNVSGVMGGDLDPTKGMYWAWNSGYINFKLEGRSPLCETTNNEFVFHLGGYSGPYSSYQSVKLLVKDKSSLIIKVDVTSFLHSIDLSTQHKTMSPGKEAKELSIQVSKIFSIL